MGRVLPAYLAAGLLLILAPLADSLAASKRALLIGINEYRANDPDQRTAAAETWIPEDLKGAINDISLMEQVLTSRFGFEASNIQRLENTQATRAAILETLQSFVDATGPEDIVYIHFSGHGSQVEDQDGDEPDGKDETILSHDARTDGVADITDDELGQIFAGLASPNSLIVLDSCHSGTATRGSSAMKTRAVPLDPRNGLYRGQRNPGTGVAGQPNYLLMTGAADYQSALDGPLDDGRYYGLFTLSLGRSLGRLPAGSTANELYAAARREMERIGGEFGLFAVPEAQLEGNDARMNQGLLGESRELARRNATRLAWSQVSPEANGFVRMRGARSLAARVGSVWAVYPPGEERFAPGRALGMLTVRSVDGDDAIAEAGTGFQVPAFGRAVQLLDAPMQERVSIRLDRVAEERKTALAAAVRSARGGQAIEFVSGPGFARFIVDERDDKFIVHGAGGLQKLADIPGTDLREAAAKLVELAERSMSVGELLALDNAASGIRMRAVANPLDSAGSVRGIAVVGAGRAPAYRVRRPDETRDHSNSLILEVETSQDAYITIVNVDPEGSVATLFPNAISEQNRFYPDGLIRANEAIRIPDGLVANRAGFNWDFVPPTGIDTVRIFAANDLVTAERIRTQVSQVGSRVVQRGAGSVDARTQLFNTTPGLQTRGIQVTPSAAPAASDWTATTINLVIEE